MRFSAFMMGELRSVVSGRVALLVGLAATIVGAGLATGIMAYEALAHDMDYTLISWVAIGPIWGALALLWLAARRFSIAAIPMGWLALFAAFYFSDVYGQYPGALLALLAAGVMISSLFPGDRKVETATPIPDSSG